LIEMSARKEIDMSDHDERIKAAITHAVKHAIDVVGIAGLRTTSMFPSSGRAR
jgi:hypothetical protein